jgi:ribose transport system permease protein
MRRRADVAGKAEVDEKGRSRPTATTRPSTVPDLTSRVGATLRQLFSGRLVDQGLLLVIVLLGFIMSQLSDVYLTRVNIINVLFQSTILATMALGVTFVILTAGIDLSVGAVAAVASVASIAAVQNFGLSTEAGILVALLLGIGIGALNGVAVAKIGITPLIATLATLTMATGLVFAYTEGANVRPVPDIYRTLATARIAGVPALIFFVLALALLAHFVLTRTTFGRSVFAVGGNSVAARLAGIRTDRILISVYMISGLTAAIGGLMLTARLGTGSPRAGMGVELTVIAAVVIGGTSLFGGQGGVRGTLLGVLLITQISNGINLLGVPPAYDNLVTGGVIFIAATLDVYRHRYTERAMSRRARRLQPSGTEGKGADNPKASAEARGGGEDDHEVD